MPLLYYNLCLVKNRRIIVRIQYVIHNFFIPFQDISAIHYAEVLN